MNQKSAAVRVALLDDHPVVLRGIELQLASCPGIQVVGVFHASAALLRHLRQAPVDIVLMDYALGHDDIDGLNLIRLLRSRFPASAVLVLSGLRTPATVRLALSAGAKGYVCKDRSTEELLTAVLAVGSGKGYVSSPLDESSAPLSPAGSARDPTPPPRPEGSMALTFREHEVLRCLLEGQSVSQIAAKFSRSIKTISTQKTSAFRKLGIRTYGELFKLRADLSSALPDRDHNAQRHQDAKG